MLKALTSTPDQCASGQETWRSSAPPHALCYGRKSSWIYSRSPVVLTSISGSRSIALWDRKKYIVAILGVLCLAHWALLYRTMFVVTAEWNETARTCAVTSTNSSLLNVTFFFSAWILRFVSTVPLTATRCLLGFAVDRPWY